jgi:3-oxoacyl-[acyl-carrier protein] reductase
LNFPELKKKFVLVTGSSSGIGLGIAEGFLKQGAHVIINGRSNEKLTNSLKKLSKTYNNDQIYKFKGDVSDKSIIDSLFDFLKQNNIKLSHLVCNVGSGKSVPILTEDKKEFERMMNTNLYSATNIVNKLLPELERNGKDSNFSPTITLISSICSLERLGCPIAYSASKSALNSYAKNIAFPLGRKGIRMNVVSPGNILFQGSTWEEKIQSEPDSVNKMLENEVSLKILGDVEDVANAVVFLASKSAKFIHGSNIVIDGGQLRS